jgi:hypothetical protein
VQNDDAGHKAGNGGNGKPGGHLAARGRNEDIGHDRSPVHNGIRRRRIDSNPWGFSFVGREDQRKRIWEVFFCTLLVFIVNN